MRPKKLLLLAFSIILFAGTLATAFLLFRNNQKIRETEEVYAKANNIGYGLLNENNWKNQVSAIIEDEVSKAFLNDSVTHVVSRFISKKISEKLDATIPNFNLLGFSKEKVVNSFSESRFMGSLVDDLSKMLGEVAVSVNLPSVMSNILTKTIGVINKDNDGLQKILKKYRQPDLPSLNKRLEQDIDFYANKETLYGSIAITLIICLSLLCMYGVKKMRYKTSFVVLTLTIFVSLVLGVYLPLINLDARIEHLSVSFLSNNIEFSNQIVFFQSKSIWGVIAVLFEQKSFQMILVGILILLFSILIPTFKLTASTIVVLKQTDNKFSAFLKDLGKWSMADVFTIALFMAYMGLNGIIKGSLDQLDGDYKDAIINTANYTRFRVGLLFFVLYTLLSIISSYFFRHRKPFSTG
jgi:hypothetical protein